jgi:hypothetical protein
VVSGEIGVPESDGVKTAKTSTLSPTFNNAVETEVSKDESVLTDLRKSVENKTKEPTYREGKITMNAWKRERERER